MAAHALFKCPRCRAFAQLQIDGWHAKTGGEEGDLPTKLLFGHCIRCGQVGIVEEVETGPNQWDREWGAQVYPR